MPVWPQTAMKTEGWRGRNQIHQGIGRGSNIGRAGCIWAIRYLENYTHKGACEKQSKEGQVYSGTDTETKKSSRTGSEGGNKGNGELQSIQKKGKRGVSSLCVFSQ